MVSALRLRLSMVGSLAAIIAVTTLAAAVVLTLAGASVVMAFALVIPFFLLQWYLGPKMVERAYRVEPADRQNFPELHEVVEEISERSGIDKPEVMVADVDLPNAFAYGNTWTGDRVAVTRGLMEKLEWEEVEAVIGHEIGHVKHRDSSVMMVLSILPALFLMVGRMFFWSTLFGGRQRNQGGLPLIAVAAASMLIYFVLQLCIMGFSRTREYYADRHSASTVDEGARKLAEGLAKINEGTRSMAEKRRSSDKDVGALGLSLKPLLVSDPDTSAVEGRARTDRELVEKYAGREVSLGERLAEVFSTHPNITKRLNSMGF